MLMWIQDAVVNADMVSDEGIFMDMDLDVELKWIEMQMWMWI